MKLVTRYHGEREIDPPEVIQFPRGIPGFEDETEFVLLPLTDDQVFFILQSVQTSDLAFVVTDPFLFYQDYDFQLDEATVKSLELGSPSEVRVLTILTVKDPFKETTVNLQAPVVINVPKKIAKQVVLNVDTYHTKHRLYRDNPVGTKR
ncbi:flagellar assembly protein FliW [Bacillus litorisediminis]|uniref:flagellar assembly protein FliW n=1 Tax=Bacillus litorisediminis TaxID=2922713 RepID=UPI001FAC88FA|nr:flagellar assembly protein FliW [Bacillus litorisediminis]